MKKNFWMALLAMAIMPLFFVACSDDDDDNGKKNHFTYDGKTYELHRGMMMDYGNWWGEGRNFDVLLHSDGLQFNEDEFEFSGTGHGIFFEMYSSSDTELAPGTYTYDPEDEGTPGTFAWADLVIDFNVETEQGTEVTIVGGTVTVARSGSNYELTINATAAGGKPVTGFYRGALSYYNMEDYWKALPAKPRGFSESSHIDFP